jgi:glycosyltransferase involved in cell wall biosynthesis
MRIVVLDDCSTEDVEGVVRSFDDSRIEYIKNDRNLGLVGNWNKAFEVCDTEYLNIFHDDDRMFPWMIEALVGVLDNNQQAAIALSGNFFMLGLSPIPDIPKKIEGVMRYKNELIKDICAKGHNYLLCPSAFFRKKAIDRSGIFFRDDAGLAADLYFWLEANSKGIPLYILKCPLLEYRIHASSCSNTSSMEKWILTHKKIDEFIVGMNLNYNMRKLRETFAIHAVLSYVKSDRENFDFKYVEKLRVRLKNEMGWIVPDKTLNDAVVVECLGESITAVGKGQIRFSDFLKKQRILKQKGLQVPLGRQMKWLIKYVVLLRICSKFIRSS